MTEPITRASLFDTFEEFITARGGDFDSLLHQTGLAREVLSDPSNDISLNAAAELLNAAAVAVNDPCLGIHWAEAYPRGASGVLGYLLLHSKSVRDCVKTLARYVALHLDPVDLSFQESEGAGHLTWRFPLSFNVSRQQYASFAMTITVIHLRRCAGTNWMPMGVDLEHRTLACSDEVRRLLGPNVRYDQPCNALHIRDAVLERTSNTDDERLFRLIRELGERILSERKIQADIIQQTRKTLVERLESGEAALEYVAGAMGLSPRTLQTQLAAGGTNYDTLLHETRQALAELYLRDTDLPLTEIAFLLGFSELSAFTRAANRWFGVPPRQYRAQLRCGVGST